MNATVTKLTSRKFLLALGAFLTAVDNGQSLLAAAVALIYVLTEAKLDAKSMPSGD